MDKKPADACWDEALDWLFRVNANPGDAILQRHLEAWLRADPRHAAALAEARSVWEVTGGLPADEDCRLPAAARDSVPRARSYLRFGARVPLAWAVAASFALMLLFAPQLYLRAVSDAVTGTAEVRAITLRDGSRVVLAPQSAIAAQYESSGLRRTDLLQGAAYFEVKSDPQHPFIVRAGELRVRVLGTGFEVRRARDEIVVAVRHGHVRVELEKAPAARADLTGGEQVRVRLAGGRLTKTSIAPHSVGAWQYGSFEVHDWTLGELAEALDRYRAGVVIVSNAELARAPVAGVYRTDAPDTSLEAAAQLHGARVHRLTPWLLWIARKESNR